MVPATLSQRPRTRFVFYKQHVLHPIKSYRAFKAIKFQVELNNEVLKIQREIQLYGHPLLTGITTI